EVGAVCVNAHVRICAGGGLRRPSLPRRQTEFVWKRAIRLGCKALRLKTKHVDQIHYCQLGKLAVVKASNQNKALATFKVNRDGPVRTPAPPPRLAVCRGQRRCRRPDSRPVRGRVDRRPASDRYRPDEKDWHAFVA